MSGSAAAHFERGHAHIISSHLRIFQILLKPRHSLRKRLLLCKPRFLRRHIPFYSEAVLCIRVHAYLPRGAFLRQYLFGLVALGGRENSIHLCRNC